MQNDNQSKNKILIIDTGMQNLGGHNFSYTRAVEEALAEKGFETEVFANRKLSDELAKSSGYRPIFTQGAYDFPPFKGIRRDLPHIYAQSILYSNELEHILENNLSDYAAIFCHTIGDFELIGWNSFLKRNKLNSHLFLLMRNTPGLSSLSFIKKKIHPYFRIKPHYLNSIHSKLKERFTMLTDSDLLTNDYASVYKHKILTMPIPINKYFLADEDNFSASLNAFKNRYDIDKSKGLCIGYMGDSRGVKGFDLLPDLVLNVLSENANAYFAIQCPKAANSRETDAHPKGAARLYNLKEKFNERLILVSERLSEEDYANMFRCLDIALIPYTGITYREATSGIFAETVALGKPSVVTENTWMSHELKKFGGGLEIKSGDSKDLTEKVFELIKNYGSYKTKAENYKSKWCEFHNSHTLAEMLVNEIKPK